GQSGGNHEDVEDDRSGRRGGKTSENVLDAAQDGRRTNENEIRQHERGQSKNQGILGLAGIAPIERPDDDFAQDADAGQQDQQQPHQPSSQPVGGIAALLSERLGENRDAGGREGSLTKQAA